MADDALPNRARDAKIKWRAVFGDGGKRLD
jgi:hypothetical protein